MDYRWALVGSLFLLGSCQQNGWWADGKIDEKMRGQMSDLNKGLIVGIAAKDSEQLRPLFTDSLWTAEGRTFVDQIVANKLTPHLNKFKVKNQFYIRYGDDGSATVLRRTKGNDRDYTLTVQPLTAETEVTLGYFSDTPESFALTSAFGKYGSTWKLNVLQLGLLKIMNGDAIDWYHRARHDFEHGYLADAGNDLLVCEQLMKPGGSLIRYDKEKDVYDLDQQLTQAITHRYPFPLTDSLVATKPSIFKISLYRTPEGYYPFILYHTRLLLTDSIGINKECNAVCAHLGKLFNGLDQGKRYLFFRAYGKFPGEVADSSYKEFKREGRRGEEYSFP